MITRYRRRNLPGALDALLLVLTGAGWVMVVYLIARELSK